MSSVNKTREDRGLRRDLIRDHALEDIHTYGVDRKAYTIYVGGNPRSNTDENNNDPGIDFNTASGHIKNLDFLSSRNRNKPILIKISSPGGYVEEGREMMDAMLACSNPITAYCTKGAYSMASLLPLVADRFVMAPSASYMYHYGYSEFSTRMGPEMYTQEKLHNLFTDWLLRTYTARLSEQGKFKRLGMKNIRAMLEDNLTRQVDVYLSSQEAKEWGFVDEIYTGKEVLRTRHVNHARRERMWDVIRERMKVIPARVVPARTKTS